MKFGIKEHIPMQMFSYMQSGPKPIDANSPQIRQPLNYLSGQRVNPQSSELFPVHNPATGDILRHVASSAQLDVDDAVMSAAAAYKQWSKLSGAERGKILNKAVFYIRERSEELARTECLDTGKPIWEARKDIADCADKFEYYAGVAPTLTGEHITLSGGSFGFTRPEPLGVIGALGAWNYPALMVAMKSAPALACGNTMVYKPSPMTPFTTVMLAELLTKAGLPNGCFNVVQGAAKTGQIICCHPRIAKMTFTGIVPNITKVAQACAQGMKPVTLEQCGKSPLLIFDDCNLDNAVKGAMLANFLTQGQVCSNGTRVYVQKSIMNEFLDRLVARTRKMKIGDPMLEDTTVGAMICREQADKVLEYIAIGIAEGGKVLYGGERVIPEDPKLVNGYYLSPCIFVHCHDNMRIIREEIFGPIMSVMSFDTEEEVIARANNSDYGLAGGVFTKDLTCAHRVVQQLEAGFVFVNNYNVYPVGLPFGGFKKSGIGRENSRATVDYYTQIKSVYVEMGDVECPL